MSVAALPKIINNYAKGKSGVLMRIRNVYVVRNAHIMATPTCHVHVVILRSTVHYEAQACQGAHGQLVERRF